MRKTLVTLLLISLVAGALAGPAAAQKKKKKKAKKPVRIEREVQGSYAAPATIVGSCSQTDGIGCVGIASGAGENFLTAKVTDNHGQPVAISVQADLDGDMRTETTYGTFCGETTEPIKVDPGVELVFWVGRAADAATTGCAPGFGTQGTIDVIFSNLP